MKRTPSTFLGILVALSIGHADEPALSLQPITVEARRIPTDPSRTGASLSVLTAEDLSAFGNVPLGYVLQTLPGVHFARSGPRGSLNTFVIRGNTQTYTLIRVDGVNVSDPASSQVQPLVQHLTMSDIERIEVLRGSQSSLYGGQAVAGVIEITTKDGAREGTGGKVFLEAGSFDTYQGTASASHSGERGSVRISAERLDSEGFSAADEKDGATEADGYENTMVTVRGSYELNPNLLFKGLVRHSDFRNEFDGFAFGVGPVDAVGEETLGTFTQAVAGLTGTLNEGKRVHDFQVSYFEMDRETRGAFPATFLGDRTEVDYVGNEELTSQLTLLYGANGFRETVDNGSGLKEDSQIIGGFVQAELQPIEAFRLSATGRVDEHSEFGSEATWRSTAAFQLSEQTRIRGSGGTGFRAPSLFELFDESFGNPDLQPETSVSWDVGIDQSWAEDRWVLELTFFDLSVTDKIDFLFPLGFTTVEGESQTQGVEAAFRGQLTEDVLLVVSYTWISKAENAQGDPLLRVPEHDLSVIGLWSVEEWTVRGAATYIRGVEDLDYSGRIPTSELPSYWVVDGSVSYQLTPSVSLQARMENILDEQYQEVRGYGTADRSIYAAVEMEF